jgi:hypothetical protein
MADFERRLLPGVLAESLAWRGEELVDWVSGGRTYQPDGTVVEGAVSWGSRFDAATVAPSGRYVVLFERLGTRGLVLNSRGEPLREINRTDDLADVYEYPVALFTLAGGAECLAHCPDSSYQLVLEDPGTGRRLTVAPPHEDRDFYFSRLAGDPSGRFLLSAGWVWHPVDDLALYEIQAGDPGAGLCLVPCSFLDRPFYHGDVSGAAFGPANQLLVSSRFEGAREGEPDRNDPNRPSGEPGTHSPGWQILEVFDLSSRVRVAVIPLEFPEGVLLPVGQRHVVGFHTHPKLIDWTTGQVFLRWPDLATGEQTSSIIHHLPSGPVLALDPAQPRFAVAGEEGITVITLIGDL